MKSNIKTKSKKRFWRLLITTCTIIIAMMTVASVSAYGPSTLYTPPGGAPAPGAFYGRAMQASDGSMYATFEQYTTGTPVYPIYRSTNAGQTWTQVGSVSDTQHGYGMRYQPFLYQLPQAIGSLAAGTLLCAGNCIPSSLASTEIDIYYSTNQGATWTFLSTVCTGGAANPDGTHTPVWEPFLMVYNNQLVCFYSDERQKPTYNQCLGHETSSNGTTWSAETYDVALSTANYRPGMAVVSQMPNGSYILTYEVVNYNGLTYTNQPTFYKTSTNPLSWNPTSIGTEIAAGGCPYVVQSDGNLVVNNYDSGSVYINDNNGVGAWTTLSTPMAAAYSRCMVPLSNGRLFIIGAGMIGGTANPVTYADMAMTTAYYGFQNYADSNMIDTDGNTGVGSNVCQYAKSVSYNQQWAIIPQSDGNVKIQNRTTGLYLDTMGRTGNGSIVGQNSLSTSLNQEWQITPYNGYVRIISAANGLCVDTGGLAAPNPLEMYAASVSYNQEWTEIAN